MRIPLSTSLVALAISGALAHIPQSPSQGRVRKSLGFGPEIPHAVFNTSPEQLVQGFSSNPASSPFEVAESFVAQLLRKDSHFSDHSTYTVRSDSYTDDNTGVTHVYFRQLINGIEVSDGLMNVNVKDGVILSYGDSFYRGPAPESFPSSAQNKDVNEFWNNGCYQLSSALQNTLQENFQSLNGQIPLARSDVSESRRQHIEQLFTTNCQDVARSSLLFSNEDNQFGTARDAVLKFIAAATPDEGLSRDILNRFGDYWDGIHSTFEHHLTSSDGPQTIELLSGVPETVNPAKAYLAYVQVPKGDKSELTLVWKLEVEMQDNWYEAAVTAHQPHNIVSVVDWASDAAVDPLPFAPTPKKPVERAERATYNVFGWGVNDPECGNRTLEKESVDKLASPLGWHSIPVANDPKSQGLRLKGGIRNYTTTWGNNVFAHENWEGRNNWEDNYRPDAGQELVFDYSYDPKETDAPDAREEAQKYINTTVTQLFYTSNMVHDLYYRYGFDEKAGNFQQDNFGRGGREGDAVIANAQDGSGFNNANFMTPPDGQNGRCRMYLWNTAVPYRDGDLEAGIVIHELSHGLSTRLTGGPLNSGCLGWGESGGMGEGWGDLLATVIRSTSTYQDYSMGAWAANREAGIRRYLYSTNDTVNPFTYKTLDSPGFWEVHAIGEVWAEMLWVVTQKLINKHGFSETLFPPIPLEDGTIPTGDFYLPAEFDAQGKQRPLIPKHGNSLAVQLIINGMKLQKCQPSFFDARDAIIQADQVLTGGENFCEIWEGFSERGLGQDATVIGRTPWGGGIRTNGFTVPDACKKDDEPEVPGDGDDDDDFY